MKKFLNHILNYTAVLLITALSACEKNEFVEPSIRQMTLVYAVNRNNLASDLRANQRQMLEAYAKADIRTTALLLYKTIDDKTCGLYRAYKNGQETGWELVESFSRTIPSTHPERISEVMEYALSLYDAADNNLFLWGHGTAWTPTGSDHILKSKATEAVDLPDAHAYGGENNGSANDWTDITELSDAIPDGRFDTIWFDCCYMSNIETAYQLRGKCRNYVAYPTEIDAAGLPYDLVLPFVFGKQKDLAAAAKTLYDFYVRKNTCVTVAVWDMLKLDALADRTAAVLASGAEIPSPSGLLNYSRTAGSPYYDFGQYISKYAAANGADALIPAFRQALSDVVTCSYASEIDFNRNPIPSETFTGVSTHRYTGREGFENDYYRSLDWFRAVYGGNDRQHTRASGFN